MILITLIIYEIFIKKKIFVYIFTLVILNISYFIQMIFSFLELIFRIFIESFINF